MSINGTEYCIILQNIVRALGTMVGEDDMASVQINTGGRCILVVGLGHARSLTVAEFADVLDKSTDHQINEDLMTAEEQVQSLLAAGNTHRARQVARSVESPQRVAAMRAAIEAFDEASKLPAAEPVVATPTEFGKTVYPPDGMYDGSPCTCESSCGSASGCRCVCTACGNARLDAINNNW